MTTATGDEDGDVDNFDYVDGDANDAEDLITLLMTILMTS